MRSWVHGLYAALILLGVLLSYWQIQRAAGDIRGAAADLISQTQDLKARMERMISITYQSAMGRKVTVTTNIGDQQDGEPADVYERQVHRLAAALAIWPE